jgi:hypothetical protein
MTDPSLSAQSGSTLAAGALEAQGAPRRRLAIGALTLGLVLVGALAAVAAVRGKGQTTIIQVMSAAPQAAATPVAPSAAEPQPSGKTASKDEVVIPVDSLKPTTEEGEDPNARKRVVRGGPAVAPGFKPPPGPAPDPTPPKPAAPVPKPAPASGSWDKTGAGF